MPAGGQRQTGDALREEDSVHAGASRLSAAGDRSRSRDLLGFYRTGSRDGGFEAGIEIALNRILVSPKFLFRIERDPANVAPGTLYRVSDLELASRLSFFLWSSIPDDELWIGRARQAEGPCGAGTAGAADARAIRRSKALVSNFAGQWLYLRNLRSPLRRIQDVFPDFDENLREAFQHETELFFESICARTAACSDLLDADYTFLNERLARHYGIPNVYGSHFRRVTLSDEDRRGLLGQGSILTVTSYAEHGPRRCCAASGCWKTSWARRRRRRRRTSPALKEAHEDGKVLTMRQRMEQHRANPACASCHAQMDPLGFALENFDAIGRWRTDRSGCARSMRPECFPTAPSFEGPADFATVLLTSARGIRRDRHRTAAHLRPGPRGRVLRSAGDPQDHAGAAPGDYRWSSLILGIVKSTPFQMRRSREP